MELNERQLALYSYLTANSHQEYVGKYYLMAALEKYYGREEELSRGIPDYNSSAFRTLRSDIAKINKSSAQYVILSHIEDGKLKGYKLATRNEQIAKQAEKLQRQAIKMLALARELHRKARNNGQVRMNATGTKEIRSEAR